MPDKEVKCKNYNLIKNLKYINSTSSLSFNDRNIYLIIDSSKSEVMYRKHKIFQNLEENVHIVGMAGSDLTFYNEKKFNAKTIIQYKILNISIAHLLYHIIIAYRE